VSIAIAMDFCFYIRLSQSRQAIKRPGVLFFNAGCNEQVLSPKHWKKFAQIRHVVFEKNSKKHTLIPKN